MKRSPNAAIYCCCFTAMMLLLLLIAFQPPPPVYTAKHRPMNLNKRKPLNIKRVSAIAKRVQPPSPLLAIAPPKGDENQVDLVRHVRLYKDKVAMPLAFTCLLHFEDMRRMCKTLMNVSHSIVLLNKAVKTAGNANIKTVEEDFDYIVHFIGKHKNKLYTQWQSKVGQTTEQKVRSELDAAIRKDLHPSDPTIQALQMRQNLDSVFKSNAFSLQKMASIPVAAGTTTPTSSPLMNELVYKSLEIANRVEKEFSGNQRRLLLFSLQQFALNALITAIGHEEQQTIASILMEWSFTLNSY